MNILYSRALEFHSSELDVFKINEINLNGIRHRRIILCYIILYSEDYNFQILTQRKMKSLRVPFE